MKNLITILCLCLSLNLILGCIDGEEVELWGECYNIEETKNISVIGYEECVEKGIPDNIGQLVNLESFWFHCYVPYKKDRINLPTFLPESMGNLKKLKTLHIQHINITSLPESFKNLTNLVNLDLYGNNLTSVPESIGDFKKLKKLNLGSNQLTSIPETIGNLSSLRSLRLDRNPIDSIPETIGNLNKLLELDLSSMELVSLPESICNLSDNCYIITYYNKLCERYHYDCIDDFDCYMFEEKYGYKYGHCQECED